jgi:acetolactate synthase-1/2/3 large subunit
MGFALPAAIGASLLDRSRPTVALTGDGGLLMCAGELLTAAREQLPVITVVFNDASLSLIEIKQRARALPRAGVALGAVDWVQMAESMGVAAWRATDKRSLERAIGRARRRGGPALIDVKIDPSNYGATLRAVRG